jgi:chaperone modulatory protein CbpM
METDLQCTIFDENNEFTLRELCDMCRVHAQFIEDLIDEGILSPRGTHPHEYRFSAVAIKRIQISIRLKDDLRVNLPGTALALNLLEEIEELKRFKHQLEQLHELEQY